MNLTDSFVTNESIQEDSPELQSEVAQKKSVDDNIRFIASDHIFEITDLAKLFEISKEGVVEVRGHYGISPYEHIQYGYVKENGKTKFYVNDHASNRHVAFSEELFTKSLMHGYRIMRICADKNYDTWNLTSIVVEEDRLILLFSTLGRGRHVYLLDKDKALKDISFYSSCKHGTGRDDGVHKTSSDLIELVYNSTSYVISSDKLLLLVQKYPKKYILREDQIMTECDLPSGFAISDILDLYNAN